MKTPRVTISCFMWLSVITIINCNNCIEKTFENVNITVCSEYCVEKENVGHCVNSEDYRSDILEVYLHTNVRKFRRGAFFNMPLLKSIYSSNCSVEIVFPGAFINLPEIDVIDLSFNRMEDVVLDVFNDLNVRRLALSSNSISYIDRGAFSNMPSLDSLLLDNNNLREFNKHWLTNSTSLKVLDLSNNNILTLWAWSFEFLPNLAYLDVSFNKITEIGLGAFINVKLLNFVDFTGNNITELKANIFYRGIKVRELRLAMNEISSLSEELFTTADIHSIALHMNPWMCPDLKEVMEWTNMYKVKILDRNADERIDNVIESPICTCPVNVSPLECAL